MMLNLLRQIGRKSRCRRVICKVTTVKHKDIVSLTIRDKAAREGIRESINGKDFEDRGIKITEKSGNISIESGSYEDIEFVLETLLTQAKNHFGPKAKPSSSPSVKDKDSKDSKEGNEVTEFKGGIDR